MGAVEYIRSDIPIERRMATFYAIAQRLERMRMQAIQPGRGDSSFRGAMAERDDKVKLGRRHLINLALADADPSERRDAIRFFLDRAGPEVWTVREVRGLLELTVDFERNARTVAPPVWIEESIAPLVKKAETLAQQAVQNEQAYARLCKIVKS